MNEQMREVARATASKDPAITGAGLLEYGTNIYKRDELPTEINTKAKKVSEPSKYTVGQIIEKGNKKYKVTNADNPTNPEIEEIK